MSNPSADIADLLQEDRSFPPSDEFRRQANINDEGVYARAERDPEAFWARFAGELEWSTPWSRVLDWQPPHAKWFVGGTLNASVNCVDRHARGSRRNSRWRGASRLLVCDPHGHRDRHLLVDLRCRPGGSLGFENSRQERSPRSARDRGSQKSLISPTLLG